MAAIVPGQGGSEGSLASFANPSIQNGYYQFIQTTAPTQRSSGVPLVTGDRWYKPIDNGVAGTRGDWIWSGAYWLTENVHAHESAGFPTIAAVNTAMTTEGGDFAGTFGSADLVGIPFTYNNLIWLSSLSLCVISNSVTSVNFSGSNSVELWPTLTQSFSTRALAVTVNTSTKIGTFPSGGTSPTQWTIDSTVNILTLGNLFRPGIYCRNKVGTPAFSGTGNIGISFAINIRGIHP